MNDHELDRLVASATHVRDGWVDGFDLRAAEDELLEEIMATTDMDPPVPLAPAPSDGPSPFDREAGRFDGRPDRRRFRLAVALGAAAAVLVGVVLMRSTGGDGDRDGADEPGDVGTSADQAVAPMIVDPLPDGFEVGLITPEEGLAPEPLPDEEVDTWVHGDLTEAGLTNDVVISVEPSAPSVEVEPEGEGVGGALGEPVTVRGKEGTLCSFGPPLTACEPGVQLTGVSWTESPDLYITVQSRTFDREQVLAIAEGLRVEGTTVELGDMPSGVTKPPEVAELDNELVSDDLITGASYMVTYGSPDGRSFSVTTGPEDEARRLYDLWLSGPRDDQVQGHAASVEDMGGIHTLTWSPVPGQVVELMTDGTLDEATARQLAELVRPATDAEWADLQQQVAARPPDAPIPGQTTPATVEREVSGGAVVRAHQAEEVLCYDVDGQGMVCHNNATDVLAVSTTGSDGQLHWDVPATVGVAPDGTVSIDGGETTFGESVDGGQLFVWEFSGEQPTSVTFRDAEGNVIATREVFVY